MARHEEGGLVDLLAKKALDSTAWDEGTVLQIRMSVFVGDPNSAAPAQVHVETTGKLEHAPEALLWLVVRTLTDVDGLHQRSAQVGGLGVEDYVRLVESRATGREDRSRAGRTWGMMLRAVSLTSQRPPTSDLSVVMNLVDGGVSKLKWIGMIHLQGPVGDIAHVYAPWLVWNHLERVLPAKEKAVIKRYMETLAKAPRRWQSTSPIEAAQWVDAVVRAAGR